VRVWLFRMVTLLIPFLFFAGVEWGLRVADYGRDYPLFIENPPAPDLLLPRPDIVKRYFPEGAPTPSVTIEVNFFKKQKPKDGIRLFVQGGSSAAGFPYGYGASPAGMLDYRLKQSFPDRPVEVINTALSAVNSYTMLDFADEIIEQSPDAVLIYAGHNEYLGILGVGSAYTAANSQAATLLYLKLRKMRIFQLMQNVYASFKYPQSGLDEEKSEASRTFMSKVAKHKNIPLESDLFQQGVEQFRTNLGLLLDKYQREGIPVYLATIASNLKDQPPFSSNQASLTSEMAEWVDHLRHRRFDRVSDGNVAALDKVAKDSDSADILYLIGQWHLKQENFGAAKQYFELAKDHDLLRFRAPNAMNEIIREFAERDGVTLVDVERAMARQLPGGLIGKELMLEHLHPNLNGYFLIADTFYRRMYESKIFNNWKFVPSESALKELPVLPPQRYLGEAKIAQLVADYPFVKTKQEPELPAVKGWADALGLKAFKKQANWIDMANATIQQTQENEPGEFAKAVKLLAEALPHDANLSYQAGLVLLKGGRVVEAPRYLLKALDRQPENVAYLNALCFAYFEMKNLSKAEMWVDKALQIAPNDETALENKAVINRLKARGFR